MTILETAAALRSRAVSSVELTKTLGRRLEKLGPEYNALAYSLVKRGHKAAKDADFTSDVAAPSRFADTPLIVYHPKDGDNLFALQVQPTLPPAKARPRDVVVLVDTTASQAGGHLLAAEKLVEALVPKLGDDDRVSLRTVKRRWLSARCLLRQKLNETEPD